MNDLKFAFRQLRKTPVFTAVAVLTLALGIGVNTAFFKAFNSLVLRPLQVKDPDAVVNLFSGYGQFSYPEYVYYRDYNDVLSGLVACAPVPLVLDGGISDGRSSTSGASERIRGLQFPGITFPCSGRRSKRVEYSLRKRTRTRERIRWRF